MSFAPPGGPLDDTVVAGTCSTLGCTSIQALDSSVHWSVSRPARPRPDDAAGRIIRRRTRSLCPACRVRSLGCSDAGSDQCSAPCRGLAMAHAAARASAARSSIFPRSLALLARSGGEPIEVFGEWTHRGFRPLSLLGTDATEPFSTAVVARAA